MSRLELAGVTFHVAAYLAGAVAAWNLGGQAALNGYLAALIGAVAGLQAVRAGRR